MVDGISRRVSGRLTCVDCKPHKKSVKYQENQLKKSKKTKKYSDYLLNYYRQRVDRKIEIVRLKGGKCEKCGYDKCLDCLQFHHIDPETKSFPLSKEFLWRTKWEKILVELDKCQLLCANCHSEIHSKFQKSVPELIQELNGKQFS